jgi:hypothetical protein
VHDFVVFQLPAGFPADLADSCDFQLPVKPPLRFVTHMPLAFDPGNLFIVGDPFQLPSAGFARLRGRPLSKSRPPTARRNGAVPRARVSTPGRLSSRPHDSLAGALLLAQAFQLPAG